MTNIDNKLISYFYCPENAINFNYNEKILINNISYTQFKLYRSNIQDIIFFIKSICRNRNKIINND